MMNLAEFHFIRPYWLFSLIPVLLILVLLFRNKLNRGNWSTVCDAELLPFVLQEKSEHKKRWTLSAGLIAAILIIFAIAGPTWERLPTPVFRNDAALVIALDLSRSMNATDIKPSRLSRARYKITDILKQRTDGQTALIAYAGDSFIVTPLTDDRETIISQISALSTQIMPSPGSNTAIAIDQAVALLKQAGLQAGDILLVTDEVNYDETIDTVESLSAYHLSILGIGTEDGAPIKLAQGGFLKDKQGNIVVPKLDSSTLSKLASKGHGLYQTISSDDNDIKAIIKKIDNPAEKQEGKDNNLLIDQWNEKGPWLLLLALPLVALSFRKGILLALLFILPFPETSYALDWNDLWQNQDQQADKAFKQQKYQQAAEQFDNPQWKAAAHYKAGGFEQALESLQDDKTTTGLYNKANALAKSGKLPEAVEAYQQALKQSPNHEDAKYNKAQVEKEIEKQQQQQNKDQQQSDKENQNQQGDKSEQSGEQSSEQNQNQQKNEQNSDSNPSEQQEQEQQQSDDQKAEEAAKNQQDQEQSAPETTPNQADSEAEYDESEQASEQWLKRIPDDPAGLLKRKFKYQYSKRKRKTNNNQAW